MRVFALPLVALALLAPPPQDAFHVTPIQRGKDGFLLIENLPTPIGLVDVLSPVGDDWCVARLNDGPWSLPVPINALGGNQVPAVVSTTFCVSFPVVTPWGACVALTDPVEYTVTAGGEGVSLEEATNHVKAEIAAINGFHVPCP